MLPTRALAIGLLATAISQGQAQTFTPIVEDSIDFTITGTTNSTLDSVALFPYATNGDAEKFPIHEGAFTIKSRLPRHKFFQIEDDTNSDLYFFAEETPTHINLATGDISGSDVQKRFISSQVSLQNLHKAIKPWQQSLSDDEWQRALSLYRGEEVPNATPQDSANAQKHADHIAKQNALILQILRENQDNIIPAWYLDQYAGLFTFEDLQGVMRKDAPYAHHPSMEWAWKYYHNLQLQADLIGKPAPDFEAETPDSTQHHLSEYIGQGQYVVLDFWASWCGPCVQMFPEMKQLHETYSQRGLRIIGVSCDQERAAWLKALDKHQLPWMGLRSPRRKGDAGELYGVFGIPTVVLIGPDGKVLFTEVLGFGLKKKLEELLGK